MKKRIVILTGAGISAESGIKTFRDAGGLWEGHQIEEVATPEAFTKNPVLVLQFYNQRRAQLLEVMPNPAHFALAELEQEAHVYVITQNVDDLHERAGSKNVLHLHGELFKARSTGPSAKVIPWQKASLNLGDVCEKGHQLRPHIVWFGEAVPEIPSAIQQVQQADILAIIGTSMQVYPAAGLVHYAPAACPIWYIDPKAEQITQLNNPIKLIKEKASSGVLKWINELKQSKQL